MRIRYAPDFPALGMLNRPAERRAAGAGRTWYGEGRSKEALEGEEASSPIPGSASKCACYLVSFGSRGGADRLTGGDNTRGTHTKMVVHRPNSLCLLLDSPQPSHAPRREGEQPRDRACGAYVGWHGPNEACDHQCYVAEVKRGECTAVGWETTAEWILPLVARRAPKAPPDQATACAVRRADRVCTAV